MNDDDDWDDISLPNWSDRNVNLILMAMANPFPVSLLSIVIIYFRNRRLLALPLIFIFIVPFILKSLCEKYRKKLFSFLEIIWVETRSCCWLSWMLCSLLNRLDCTLFTCDCCKDIHIPRLNMTVFKSKCKLSLPVTMRNLHFFLMTLCCVLPIYSLYD